VDGVRDRIGVLCGQLSRWEAVEKIILDGGAGVALDELRTAIRDSQTDPGRLTELLDVIEDAGARGSLPGITTREHSYRPLPPGAASPGIEAWVCPRGRCDRVVLASDEPTAAQPLCALDARAPMKLHRIAP
jgi:hypothetical protein